MFSSGVGLLEGGAVNLSSMGRPDEIDEGVPGDGVNPLSEGVGRVVAVDVDIDFDEGFLQQVVGVQGVVGALYEEPVYSLLVTLEKVFEGDVVALQYQLHERPVVGYDIVGYLHTRSSLRSSNSPSSRAKNGLSRSYRK